MEGKEFKVTVEGLVGRVTFAVTVSSPPEPPQTVSRLWSFLHAADTWRLLQLAASSNQRQYLGWS